MHSLMRRSKHGIDMRVVAFCGSASFLWHTVLMLHVCACSHIDGCERCLEAFQAQVHVQVKRTDLEEWIKQPNLEDVLIGAVVRVALGTGKESEGQYSMCLVHDLSEGKQYTCVCRSLFCCRHVVGVISVMHA